ncbi:MAG: TonB family protein [Alphaproteobacteria bacterium]|nr:TonB family protein [Alphaproteobacteria bacterium]
MTLPFGPYTIRLPRSGLTWAVAFSILIHFAIGWYFISRLVMDQRFEAETPPITFVPMAPPVPTKLEPPPVVETDPPKPKPLKPRPTIRDVRPVDGAATVPPMAIDPGPPVEVGPVVPEAPAAPALAPSPTRRVQPAYPGKAIDREREGDVEVYVTVGAGGSVTDAQIVREDPENYGFGAAALKAVRQWEFRTATPGVYRVTVKFRLG